MPATRSQLGHDGAPSIDPASERPPVRTPPALENLLRSIEDASELDPYVDRVAKIAAPLGQGRTRELLSGKWLGHAAHPMLTDIPIGCWTSATLLDLLGGKRSRPAARRLIGLGVIAAGPTAAAGLSDWLSMRDHQTRRVGLVHAAGNTVALGLFMKSWSARRRGHHLQGKALSLVGGAAATFTGHLGGHLTLVHLAGSGERGTSRVTGRPTHHSEHEVPPPGAVPSTPEVEYAPDAGWAPRSRSEDVPPPGSVPSTPEVENAPAQRRSSRSDKSRDAGTTGTTGTGTAASLPADAQDAAAPR